MKSLNGLMTPKMAAKTLNIALPNIHNRLKRGTLEGVRVDGRVFITEASVKRVLRERKVREREESR